VFDSIYNCVRAVMDEQEAVKAAKEEEQDALAKKQKEARQADLAYEAEMLSPVSPVVDASAEVGDKKGYSKRKDSDITAVLSSTMPQLAISLASINHSSSAVQSASNTKRGQKSSRVSSGKQHSSRSQLSSPVVPGEETSEQLATQPKVREYL
jgi:hypothetical protein